MKAIGLVKSGEGLEFKFVTPDDKLRNGEFVYYIYNDRKVICRVVKKSPLRLYPDIYLSKPSIDPERIIKIMGINKTEFELFEVTASIIGYYDRNLGFVNPRVIPKPGQKVYLAEEEVISETLFKKKLGEVGSIHIGYLLNRDDDVPAVLETSSIVSEHMCILASTGSGKSYLAGVLVEELLKPHNSASVLILDPHGEYHTLKEIEGLDEFRDEGYSARVKILEKDEIKIRLSELEYDELLNILPNLTDKMEAILNSVYRELEGTKFTSNDLIDAIQRRAEDERDVTARALSWRIRRYIENVEIIDDYIHISLKDILRPGMATVIQMSDMGDLDQQLLTSVILKRILNARINAEKGLSGEKIEYPVFVIVEEAHRFASRDSKSFEVLKTILSEGRKFGVGVCLISQRPSKIDSDILSQCMTQIIMRIVNPADQDNIRDSVESIGKDLISELPGLTKGQALVAGVALNTPVLIRARKRLTSHGGASKNAPEIWRRYSQGHGYSEKTEEIRIPAKQRRLFWEE
ncbi:putative ATPase [Archaeoglobus sulfaticallidus PM70-1]|uniref:Putative ATPase n=1 Tax=Archaeoglobus sulfaticallidus PM70-1 TaxID=387631 RepID=N0BJT5_9EURY|nr:ATP-binding protein [Archaeoglobus sulfaticallidus]AGK60400.1 putative ATPase [Archaeoglobus sulfaticallidus PM70-1]